MNKFVSYKILFLLVNITSVCTSFGAAPRPVVHATPKAKLNTPFFHVAVAEVALHNDIKKARAVLDDLAEHDKSLGRADVVDIQRYEDKDRDGSISLVLVAGAWSSKRHLHVGVASDIKAKDLFHGHGVRESATKFVIQTIFEHWMPKFSDGELVSVAGYAMGGTLASKCVEKWNSGGTWFSPREKVSVITIDSGAVVSPRPEICSGPQCHFTTASCPCPADWAKSHIKIPENSHPRTMSGESYVIKEALKGLIGAVSPVPWEIEDKSFTGRPSVENWWNDQHK